MDKNRDLSYETFRTQLKEVPEVPTTILEALEKPVKRNLYTFVKPAIAALFIVGVAVTFTSRNHGETTTQILASTNEQQPRASEESLEEYFSYLLTDIDSDYNELF